MGFKRYGKASFNPDLGGRAAQTFHTSYLGSIASLTAVCMGVRLKENII